MSSKRYILCLLSFVLCRQSSQKALAGPQRKVKIHITIHITKNTCENGINMIS